MTRRCRLSEEEGTVVLRLVLAPQACPGGDSVGFAPGEAVGIVELAVGEFFDGVLDRHAFVVPRDDFHECAAHQQGSACGSRVGQRDLAADEFLEGFARLGFHQLHCYYSDQSRVSTTVS